MSLLIGLIAFPITLGLLVVVESFRWSTTVQHMVKKKRRILLRKSELIYLLRT